MLIGRNDERERIAVLCRDARDGRGGALVVRGEAGIGKTALLAAVSRMAGFEVLTVTGVRPEVELGFAGLQALLDPLLDDLPHLPHAQATALRRAFGQRGGTVSDLAVCTAALALLARRAARGALLIIVDDAHCLDAASLAVVLFVARRLSRMPVAMLVAVRDPDERALRTDGLPTTHLTGLTDVDAEQLVDTPPGPTRTAILTAAAGNPLALTELAALPSVDVLESVAMGGAVPVGERLRAAFGTRLERLAPETRAALVVAAAEDGSHESTVDIAALAEAEQQGLLATSGGRVVFRHPLIRAAAYTLAPPPQRREAHGAIAACLDARGDRARALPHRALAATGPDDTLAAELARTATEVADRGGLAAATLVLRKAALLTGDPIARAHRFAEAAYTAWKSGQIELARKLVAKVGRPVDRGTGQLLAKLRGMIELYGGDQRGAFETLVRGAETLAGWAREATGRAGKEGKAGDEAGWAAGTAAREAEAAGALANRAAREAAGALANRAAREAAGALANRAAKVAAGALANRVAKGAEAAGAPANRVAKEEAGTLANRAAVAAAGRVAGDVADGVRNGVADEAADILLTAGDAALHAGDPALFDRIGERIGELDCDPGFSRLCACFPDAVAGTLTVSPWWLLGTAPRRVSHSPAHRWVVPLAIAWMGGDPREAREFAGRAVDDFRDSGMLAILVVALPWLAELDFRLGHWDLAEDHVREGLRLAADLGHLARVPDFHALLALIAAVRDDGAACHEHAHAALSGAVPVNNNLAAAWANWALGLHALGAGQLEQAIELLSTVDSQGSPARHWLVARLAAADAVEANLRAGRRAAAESIAARWPSTHANALLEQGSVEDQYRAALTNSAPPFERARVALSFGQWLRRTRQNTRARTQLRLAANLFDGLGAPRWAALAGTELRAAGGAHTSRASQNITPQEQAVVRLAAKGMSNREIGERLFLSPRTVGYHLYKVFPKLGVSNRAQLRDIAL